MGEIQIWTDDTLTLEEYVMIEEYMQEMVKRLEMGRKQYGMDYLTKNNIKEIHFELLDISNYALLEEMKLRRLLNEKKSE